MPNKYKNNPIVIDAIQFKCDLVGDEGDNIKKVFSFFESFDGREFIFVKDTELFVKTLEGNIKVDPDDYIIRGIKGEFYTCKPDIFKLTYNDSSITDNQKQEKIENLKEIIKVQGDIIMLYTNPNKPINPVDVIDKLLTLISLKT